MVLCAFYFCWAKYRKTSLSLRMGGRKQLLKLTLFVRVFPDCWENVRKALCWDELCWKQTNKGGKCSQFLCFTSSICPRLWEGGSKANPLNPKVISPCYCRFSSQVIPPLSRKGGVGTMLGLVRRSHKVSRSWRLPLNWEGSQIRISACWTEQGAFGKGKKKDPQGLTWMLGLVWCDAQEDV